MTNRLFTSEYYYFTLAGFFACEGYLWFRWIDGRASAHGAAIH